MKTLNTLANDLNLGIVQTNYGQALCGFTNYNEATEVLKQLSDEYQIVSLMRRSGANIWTVEGTICEAYDLLEYWSDRGAECYTNSDYDLFISNLEALADGVDEEDREAFMSEGRKNAECIRNLSDGSIWVFKDDRTPFVTERHLTSYFDEDNSVNYQIAIAKY